MPSAHALNDAEYADFLKMRGEFKNDPNNDSIPKGKPRPGQTPETYIALTPLGGIPALRTAGTGSAPNGTGDQPGSAECTIYQIISGILSQTAMGGTKTVYNLSITPVSGFTWIQIAREKFGKWLASPQIAGGFLAITQQHIIAGFSGDVLDSNGNHYQAYAAFGGCGHFVNCWVQWDVIYQRYTAVQIPCPVGTAT